MSYLKKLRHFIQAKRAAAKLYHYFPQAQVTAIKRSSREAINGVQRWLDDGVLDASNFNYGILGGMEERVNTPIDDHTHTPTLL